MIPRYRTREISNIWSDKNKLNLWQETELAVIRAKVNLGLLGQDVYSSVSNILRENPINIDWWLARDKKVNHDLNAFLEERLRFLPLELQCCFHQGLTSYDTEESAFAKMIWDSLRIFEKTQSPLRDILVTMAKRYRYTIMNGRTHGQEAELQSFGKRCLTWLVTVNTSMINLQKTAGGLSYSKLSGALGNYRGISPEVEKEALKILGFEPFYGATQIMPRELYAPIADALCQVVLTLNKIAIDIRLGARSGRPIYQEPFGKKQKGSSAMPHKKNTIATEQIEGMARMAKGYCQMIKDNIATWEERAIEQSSVERVAWPDLFHVVIHAAKTMTRILEGLKVFPDNMLLEIIESRGCYASGTAREFLHQHGASVGLTAEDAYRMVQLAAFNAFEPEAWLKKLRENLCSSFEQADENNKLFYKSKEGKTMYGILLMSDLKVSSQLKASGGDVKRWNDLLASIFTDNDTANQWNQIFKPSYLLRGEKKLYGEILGE